MREAVNTELQEKTKTRGSSNLIAARRYVRATWKEAA